MYNLQLVKHMSEFKCLFFLQCVSVYITKLVFCVFTPYVWVLIHVYRYPCVQVYSKHTVYPYIHMLVCGCVCIQMCSCIHVCMCAQDLEQHEGQPQARKTLLKNFVSLLFEHGRNPSKNTQSICFFFSHSTTRSKTVLKEHFAPESSWSEPLVPPAHTRRNGYLCLPRHVTEATVRPVTLAYIPHIHQSQFSLIPSQMLGNRGGRDHTL